MLFQITMNMSARSGALVHQIIGEHSAESLKQFMDLLEHADFIIVSEYYKDTKTDGKADLYDHGPIVLNTSNIGKVREYAPS